MLSASPLPSPSNLPVPVPVPLPSPSRSHVPFRLSKNNLHPAFPEARALVIDNAKAKQDWVPPLRFEHQRFKVYESAGAFVSLAHELISDLPSGNATLSDQLRRASISICLNIAEGAGEFRPREKARFCRMARRSATECAAILDILRRLNAVSDGDLRPGEQLLLEIVSVLTGLIKRLDAGKG